MTSPIQPKVSGPGSVASHDDFHNTGMLAPVSGPAAARAGVLQWAQQAAPLLGSATAALDTYRSTGPIAPRDGLLRVPPSKERDARVAACVDRVMARIDALAPEERIAAKVGQMIQYAYEALTGPDGGLTDFEAKVRAGQAGSFLYAGDRAQAERYQRIAVEESPLGIPLLFAWDVIHGLRTIFPTPLAMAASWNPSAVRRAAEIAGREAAEDGQHWTFTPMVDIARDPKWGRVVEGAGEDQLLGSRMGVAQIQGFSKYVLTCVKHFAGYGAAEGGRDYNTTDISLRRMHDVYLPPFLAAAKAGVDTAMASFNDWNGQPSVANSYLLKDVLRDQFGSNAMVVSDWNGVGELVAPGVARTRHAAAVMAANAGTDMDMQSGVYADELAKAVLAGEVDESVIDASCRRILRLKAEMGLFDDPYGAEIKKSPLERTAAREIAEESIVLLRNQGGVLPLKGKPRIALVGALADSPYDHMGSWAALGKNEDVVTIRAALSARTSVDYVPGGNRDGVSSKAEIAAAVKAAAASDVVVVVIGENADRTGEASSVQSIELPGNQRALIEALQKTGKTVVAVLTNGRPVVLPRECDAVPALVEAWQLGTEMGSAVANVLFGDKNPSGKLPISFPASNGQIPVHHQMTATGRPAVFGPDGKPENRYSSAYLDGPNAPAWPFGFGLSYTTFELGTPALSSKTVAPDGVVFVDVSVKNTGSVAGRETVQVYSRWEDSTLTQPLRKHSGFTQVDLAPGESRVVRVPVAMADFVVHDNNGKPLMPHGDYKLYVGTDSLAKAELSFTVQ